MIRHYLISGLARFRAAPFTAAVNVLTLALGLTCFIAAYGLVSGWRASDGHFANADRTYLVAQSGDVRTGAPVGLYLRQDSPDLEAVARVSQPDYDIFLTAGGRSLTLQGVRVEHSFLDIFDFDFLAGDRASALASPDGLVLTRSAAERLFGDASAVGQPVRLSGQWRGRASAPELFVTAVIEDPPASSHMAAGAGSVLPLDFFWLWPEDLLLEDASWIETEFLTYALAPADGALTPRALSARLNALAAQRIPADVRAALGLSFEAVPLSQVRERQIEAAVFSGRGGRIPMTAVILWLGVLVLAVACFNYSNLLTAQTVTRTSEFGMRKTLGAGSRRILAQIWVETGLLTVAAFVVALAAIWLAAPVLRAQIGVDLADALASDPRFLLVAAVVAVAVAAGSGAYPALISLRMRPAQALTARGAPTGSRFLVMALVGAQFAAASGLMIGVLVLRDQNAMLRDAALQAGGDPVVVLGNTGSTGLSIDTLRGRLEAYPQIQSVSATASLPWTNEEPGLARDYVPFEAPDAAPSQAWRKLIEYGFFDVFGMPVLAGRVYDPARDGAAAADRLVVDRQFAERLGFETPQDAVGAQIRVPPDMARFGVADFPPIEIIGVVETAPMYLYGGGVDGMVYRLAPGMEGVFPVIRISAADIDGGLEAIETAWGELAPDAPLNLRFADALFEESYLVAGRIGLVFSVLSFAAILISVMGLYAMASHITRERVHEVGVRKTIGATTARIVGLFLRRFSAPVLIANLIAWPVAYLAAQAYLSAFLMRIDMTARPFVASLVLMLALAWVIVLGQTLRAATVRPADVLRRA